VVFTAQTKIDEAKAFYADIKKRAAKYGRAPGDIKIMPGLTPVLGKTMADAKANYEYLQSLMPDDVALQSLSHISGGLDLSKFPLDGPLPELPPSNAAKARQALIVRTAREGNMTLRQIARHTAAGTGHRVLVGTPEYMADEMETWLKAEAADGFNVLPPYFPGALADFGRVRAARLDTHNECGRPEERSCIEEEDSLNVGDREQSGSECRPDKDGDAFDGAGDAVRRGQLFGAVGETRHPRGLSRSEDAAKQRSDRREDEHRCRGTAEADAGASGCDGDAPSDVSSDQDRFPAPPIGEGRRQWRGNRHEDQASRGPDAYRLGASYAIDPDRHRDGVGTIADQ